MTCSEMSIGVNLNSEDAKDVEFHNMPSTSKEICDKDNIDDSEVICLSSDDSDVNLLEDDDVVECNRNFEDDVNLSLILDVSVLQAQVKTSVQMDVLFKNHLMEPLTFLLPLHDFPLELKLTEVIEYCGGVVYKTVKDIDKYTAVMVKDDSLHWPFMGPVFKVSYIQACIVAKKILDISKYFKSCSKFKLKNSFNYMSVIYFKKYDWDNIPEKFFSPKKSVLDSLNKKRFHTQAGDLTIVSSDEEEQRDDNRLMPPPKKVALVTGVTKRTTVNKHTRLLYSRKEDESIVKFIVNNDGFDNLRGNLFWKKMENRNVCPQRTWQSMKEHYIKKIVYNLNCFKFLSEKQVEMLQFGVFQK